MQDDIHAVILLSAIPFTLYLGWRYGSADWKPWRVLGSLLFGLLIGMAAAFLFFCDCGSGNNPSAQIVIPAMSGVAGYYLIDEKRVATLFRIAVVVLALGLSWHFQAMVLPSDKSTCLYAGETDTNLLKGSCGREAIPEELWHTRITGIYSLRVKNSAIKSQ